ADRPHEFPVDREVAGGVDHLDTVPASGNLDVPFGPGNFRVPSLHINGDVASRVAYFDVAVWSVDRNRPGHVGNRDVTFIVAHRHRGLARHYHVHVHADPRITAPHAAGPHFVAVPILDDLDGNALGGPPRFALVPAAHALLPV